MSASLRPPPTTPVAGLAERACNDALRQLREGSPAPMAAWLRAHLFEHVLPFWERIGFDSDGGLLTCVTDAGEILGREKWLWSQWRAVWVFSRIHRRLGVGSRWLEAAQRIAALCLRTGWIEEAQGWALVVGPDGAVQRGHESTYTDAFAVYGLAELIAAGGDRTLLAPACQTADAALRALAGPRDRLPHFPYPIPAGAKPHGVPMLWSLALAELGAVAGEPRYLQAAAALSREIFGDFLRPELGLVLEYVRQDGALLPPPEGTVVVPGHAIESMWFQAHVFRHLGQAGACDATIFDAILRHLELAWDPVQGGGLRLAVDARGNALPAWRFADSKLWWPHTEALYATLLGWKTTGRSEFCDWYERLWTFCLDHYVNWEHGEWTQKLDRNLAPLAPVVALPVKDPFHLPRSLILQIELLEGNGLA